MLHYINKDVKNKRKTPSHATLTHFTIYNQSQRYFFINYIKRAEENGAFEINISITCLKLRLELYNTECHVD